MFLFIFLNIFLNTSDTVILKDTEVSGFSNAVSMTTDSKGFIYVLDNETSEIIKYNSNLKEIKRAGRKGWDSGEFDLPIYIDGSSGLDLYVSDMNNSRVQRFDLNLGFVSSLITNSEIIEDKFKINRPAGSIIVNTQDLYALDRDNQKIVIFTKGITPYSYFGSYQSLEGALAKPVKILKDSKNIIYVLDKVKGILIYDNFGTFLSNLKIDSVKSFSIYNNYLFILVKQKIIIFDCSAGAYTGSIDIPSEAENYFATDFIFLNSQKFYILEKNKLNSFTIIQKK